jgi:hypothetical protein
VVVSSGLDQNMNFNYDILTRNEGNWTKYKKSKPLNDVV